MTQTLGTPVTSVPYDENPSLAVISAVSAATDRSSSEIGPLYDVIDPEALSDLFGPTHDGRPREGGEIQFPFEGFSAVVDGRRREVRLYE